jgi:hypothetical protein
MSQAAFARALLNPDARLPDGVVGPDGLPDIKRFSVYRNTVAASLTRALEAGFPVVRQLVGQEFFGAMAVIFLRAHPPKRRELMLYGEEFPAFLAGFVPVKHLGYLPDVARLELALRQSYHAADALPIDAQKVIERTEADLMATRFSLAPSLLVLRSGWPIHGIWRANAKGDKAPVARAEDVVILRPTFDPEPHLLPAGGAAFITALGQGKTLGQAISLAAPAFDLSSVLGLLLQGNAITEAKP